MARARSFGGPAARQRPCPGRSPRSCWPRSPLTVPHGCGSRGGHDPSEHPAPPQHPLRPHRRPRPRRAALPAARPRAGRRRTAPPSTSTSSATRCAARRAPRPCAGSTRTTPACGPTAATTAASSAPTPTASSRTPSPPGCTAPGYRTALVGKYLNGYPNGAAPTYVPPGWDDWASAVVRQPVLRVRLHAEPEPDVPRVPRHRPRDYGTDVYVRLTDRFIRGAAHEHQPFFAYLVGVRAAPAGDAGAPRRRRCSRTRARRARRASTRPT